MMKRMLVLSTLDYGYYSNTRLHHFVRAFGARVENLVVMHKHRLPQALTAKERVAAFFSVRGFIFNEPGMRRIACRYLFSHKEGLGLSLLKISNPHEKKGRVKQLLSRLFSFAGSCTEWAILPSYLFLYLLHQRGKFDVVFAQGPWEGAMALILKKAGRAGLVVYDDFDYMPGNQPLSKFRQWYTSRLEQAVLKRADLVFSVGSRLAALREKEMGRKVTVVPNGVDHAAFRKAHDKKPHPPTLIYTGFVWSWAGLDIILEAMVAAKAKVKGLRFLVLGHSEPVYLDDFNRRVKELGLQGEVRYLGNKSYAELPAFLSEADIGMAVSQPIALRNYAFPLKVIEYIGAGLPVITTRGLQAADIVEAGGCGVGVEFKPEAVAEAIVALLQSPEVYRRYAENAKRLGETYDWGRITGDMLDAIERAGKEKR